MKMVFSPLFKIGLLIYVAYVIINRFIKPIPNKIAIPLLIFSIILIIADGLKLI